MLRNLYWILFGAILSGPVAAAEEPAVQLTLEDGAPLELTAFWEQLTATLYKFELEHDLCKDFQPARVNKEYDAEAFRPFLPATAVALGEVWQLDPKSVLPFLKQLHPGATDTLHHGRGSGVAAPGAWAILRALSADRAEVLMRFHVDFLLDGDGSSTSSSWLTPAQFEGRLLVDLVGDAVIGCQIGLPDGSANVDINIRTEHGMSADIGRIPRMELTGGEPLLAGAAASVGQVPLEEARLTLAQQFYPSAEVEWFELEEALAHSRESGKPMHIIALFGSLTDESC